jgi:hypothetical protein
LIQTKPFVILGAEPELRAEIGLNQTVEHLNILQLLELNSNTNFSDLTSAIPYRYFLNVSSLQATPANIDFVKVPYFEWAPSNSSLEAIDVIFYDTIAKVVDQINNVDKIALIQENSSVDELSQYYIDSALAIANMPYGALYFSKLNYSKLELKCTFFYGEDSRIKNGAWNFPYAGYRQAMMQSQLSNAFLRRSNQNWTNYEISQGVRMFPTVGNNDIKLPFGSLIGQIAYPFGVSFLLPIFVVILVKEKEDRIQIMAKMNGLHSFIYYLAHYIHFYILHILSSILFLLSGYVARMDLFTMTSWGVLVIVWFIWGHAQIAIAFFCSVFFDRSSLALGKSIFNNFSG